MAILRTGANGDQDDFIRRISGDGLGCEFHFCPAEKVEGICPLASIQLRGDFEEPFAGPVGSQVFGVTVTSRRVRRLSCFDGTTKMSQIGGQLGMSFADPNFAPGILNSAQDNMEGW